MFAHATGAFRHGLPWRRFLAGAALACIGLGAEAAPWTPASPGAPALGVWFDAADNATLTLNSSNSAQVLGWHDKSGNNRDATADPSYAPSLTTLNGRNALDFGPFLFGTTNPHMFFPEVQVSTVFKVWGSQAGGSFLMTNRYNYSWHRAGLSTNGNPEDQPSAAIFETAHGFSEAAVRSGDAITRLNGSVVDPTTTGLSGDWDIVDNRVATGTTFPSDTLASDRTYRTGGEGIAEVIVMTSRPSECDVQRIEGYLAWKWGLQGKLPANHAFKNRAPTESLLCNGGFEAGATADGDFTYHATDQSPWVLSGGAGITSAGSGYTSNNSGPPEGRLAAYLQNHGSISQTFTVPVAGNYAVYFRTLNRGQNDLQELQVTIDGTNLFQQTLPHDPFPSTWMYAATPAIALTTGSHTIQFAGLWNGYDATGFVDDVRLELAPAVSYTQLLGSFDEWQVGYQNYQYNPGAQPWTFNNAGLVANGSGLGNPDAPQGAQAAFLPSGGFMTQTWTDPGGSYRLSLSAASVPSTGTPTLTMTIDGTTAGTWVLSSGSYATVQANVTLPAGAHTVRFASSNGDSFVDNVQLAAAPATLLAQYRLEETSWNGTAGELKDSSGNGNHGKAIGSPSPTPATTSPALAGAPGTCGYATLPASGSNSGAFEVTGLGVSITAGDKTSVSFWMYWDGTDSEIPIGWKNYALLLKFGSFGFNTANGDIWGISSTGLANGWHHVAAVFQNGAVASNEIWIDGAKQTLSQQGNNVANTGFAYAASTLRLGGWSEDNTGPFNRFSGRLDEVKVYTGGMTPAQIAADYAATHVCSGTAPTPGGFDAFESSTAAGAVSGKIHTKVAGAAFSVDVVALDTPRTGVLTTFTGTVKVEILNAIDNSGALDANACRSSWTPVTSGASATLTFAGADAGRKTVTLTEPEAWRDLRLRITTPATGTVLTQACSSDDFANRPATFASFSVSDANATTAGTARSLANTGVTGGVVHKAGQPFTVRATAVNAAGVTTANYAGTPKTNIDTCSGAACNLVWTYMGGENTAFTLSTPHTVRYGTGPFRNTQLMGSGTVYCRNGDFGDPALYLAKGCDVLNMGAISLVPSAVNGVISSTATYSEAGAFTLQLVDSTFAAVDIGDGSQPSELGVVSAAIDVGRFVPDHFDVQTLAAPVLTTFGSSSCAARSFTYLGQPFGYATVPQASVIARNAGGATTAGYAGSLWKLGASGLGQGFAPTPTTPALDASGTTAPTLTANGDGTGLVVGVSSNKLRFDRSGGPIAPFNANIALSWSAQDSSEAGVTGNGSITTPTPLVFSNIAFDAGKQIRFGMLRLLPAYGSELIDLPVLVEAQYWDGQRMATNAADQCTALPATAVAMGNYQRSLAACKTGIGSANATLTSGRGYLKLAKPGNGNSGSVDLALQLGSSATGQVCSTVNASAAATAPAGLPWLQGRWGNAPAFDQNPSTRASFGQYRSPMIYQREMY